MAYVNVYDDTITYRASALGSCMNALVAARLGYREMPTPPKLKKIFEAGNALEDIAIAKMLDMGFPIADRQREVVLQVTDTIAVVGHIDGRTTINGIPVVFDVKSQGQRAWQDTDRAFDIWSQPLFAKYLWQFSVYSLVLGERPVVVRIMRNDGEAEGVCADDIHEMDVLEVPEDRLYSIDDIKARVLEVERLAQRDTPPACTENSYGCPYAYIHQSDEDEDVMALFTQSADTPYDELVAQHQEISTQIKALETELSAVRAKIVDALHNDGCEKLVTHNGTTVSLSTYSAKSLDYKAIKDAGIDLRPWYREKITERLTVTVPRQSPYQLPEVEE